MGAPLRILLLCSLLACALAGGSLAQSPLPAGDVNVAADRARSDALTPEQREQARSLFEHAFELLQSGDHSAARLAFEDGLAIDPGNTVANLYMAESLVRLGDDARALKFYNKVVTLDPASEEARQAQIALGELDAARIDALNRIVVVTDVRAPFATLAEFATYTRQPGGRGLGCSDSLSEAEANNCSTIGNWKPYCGLNSASVSCLVAKKLTPYRPFPIPHDTIMTHLSELDAAVVPMASALPLLREGKLRAIAVTGATRSPNLPRVPTLAEVGF